eukprot:6867641-Ditylum_brightwellii.AAC.1
MLQQINEWRKEGEILLPTNANLELGDTEFGKFVAEAGLYDILGSYHGIGGINSHINGTKRIDFALGTANLTRTIRQSGMRPFHAEIVSDHRGIFLDIDAHHLFRGEIHDPINTKRRRIEGKNNKIGTRYRKK